MKFSLLPVLITILSLSLSSCQNYDSRSYTKKNDYESILGNVKSVSTTNYIAVKRFGEFQKEGISYQKFVSYNKEGNKSFEKYRYKSFPWYERFFFYDNRGNLIKDVGGKNANVHYYKYDKSGNKIEENYFEPEGKLKWRCYFKYDSNGNEIKQISYDPNGKLKHNSYYRYDALGNMIENCLIRKDGYLTENYIWDYDKFGNLLEHKSLKNNGEWFYNFNINKGKHKIDGEFYYKTVYEYFESIKTIRLETYNDDGSLREIDTREYSNFDTLGNWRTCIKSNNKREDKIIVEREITYY